MNIALNRLVQTKQGHRNSLPDQEQSHVRALLPNTQFAFGLPDESGWHYLENSQFLKGAFRKSSRANGFLTLKTQQVSNLVTVVESLDSQSLSCLVQKFVRNNPKGMDLI
jgi:hypothetical protein